MNKSYRATLIFLSIIGLGLGGCASPNIVLQPDLPPVASFSTTGTTRTISLAVDGTEIGYQVSKYEEKGDKTLIGRSESLGVHLSDIWVEEPPPVFVKRLLENTLTAWGYKVLSGNELNQLHGQVNKFSLESRAINALEFQADGAIDVDLDVSLANGTQLYKGNYIGACTYRSATKIPNKENLEKLFNRCVKEFQKQLESDSKLRSALSTN